MDVNEVLTNPKSNPAVGWLKVKRGTINIDHEYQTGMVETRMNWKRHDDVTNHASRVTVDIFIWTLVYYFTPYDTTHGLYNLISLHLTLLCSC